MITEADLKAAIAECQGERNPNANTCIKLAAYYICLKEQYGESVLDRPSYSYDPVPTPPVKEKVGYYSETEFGKELEGKETDNVLKLMDELMTTLMALQPRLYDGVMRRLKDI